MNSATKRKLYNFLPWLLPTVIVVAIRLPYFGFDTLNSDEGLYAGVARAMQQGGLPYRDAWDHAAPGIFYLYRILFGIFGAWNMGAVRVAALLAHLAAALIVGHEFRRRSNGVIGSLAASFTALSIGGYLASDVVAALTETFMLPPLIAALLLLLRWCEGDRLRPILTAIFVAISIWFKIHALIIVLFLLIGAVIARRFTDTEERGDMLSAVRIIVYAGIGYLILVLPLFLAGGFRGYWNMYILYNLFYLKTGGYGIRFLVGLWHTAWQWGFPQFLVVSFAVAGYIGLLKGKSGRMGRGILLLFGMCGALLTGMAGGRLFGHYFLPAAAFAGWLAGEGILHVSKLFPRENLHQVRSLVTAGLIILTAGLLQPIIHFHGYAYKARWQMLEKDVKVGAKFPKLIRELQRITEPGQKIWVWGFAPEIYVAARRDCANRFINCNYLVGLVPWVNIDPNEDSSDLIVPGSWEKLANDLNDTPPEVIVDAAAANYQYWGKYPLRSSSSLWNYVQQNYREIGIFNGFRVYQRND